jgi:hypothetical protein
LLVASYKAVDGFHNIVVRSNILPKQKAEIAGFDPVYDVAFYRMPMIHNLNLNLESFYLPNVGQHVRILIFTFSKNVITLNAVVMKFQERQNIPFFHIKTDFSQNLVLGAPVIDAEGNILGIVVNFIYDRLEVLPMKNLIESIVDITDYDKYAFRCPYCAEILTTDMVSMGKCAYCGQILTNHLYTERDYIPGKHEAKIQQILKALNYDPFLARLDKNFWEISKANIKVFIYYDEQQSSLVAYSQLLQLPQQISPKAKSELFKLIMEENDKLQSLSLSLNRDSIMLSTMYINLETLIPQNVTELFRNLLANTHRLKELLNQKLSIYSSSSSI